MAHDIDFNWGEREENRHAYTLHHAREEDKRKREAPVKVVVLVKALSLLGQCRFIRECLRHGPHWLG